MPPEKRPGLTWVCTDCGRTLGRNDFDEITSNGTSRKVCSDEAACQAHQASA